MCQLSSRLATAICMHANQNLRVTSATDLSPVKQWEPTGGGSGQAERPQ
jgi:hypothetical protein